MYKIGTIAALALVLGGCALSPVSGTMYLPDGTPVQYVARTVEPSLFNSVVVTAVKVRNQPVETNVSAGNSIGNAGLEVGSAALAATAFVLPLALSGQL